MGRRVKSKQSDPKAPLEEGKREKPSAKKLGKRKQEPEPEQRPTKKAKGKENKKSSKVKPNGKSAARRKSSDDSDASGWDDVDEDEEESLGTERKYVPQFVARMSLMNLTFTGLSLKTARMVRALLET